MTVVGHSPHLSPSVSGPRRPRLSYLCRCGTCPLQTPRPSRGCPKLVLRALSLSVVNLFPERPALLRPRSSWPNRLQTPQNGEVRGDLLRDSQRLLEGNEADSSVVSVTACGRKDHVLSVREWLSLCCVDPETPEVTI